MNRSRYITEPKDIYTLELNKLQSYFSEVSKIGEEASELIRVSWRQVECLRHMNFMLESVMQVGKMILEHAS